MPSVQDERGFNQGWEGSASLQVRQARRCALIASRMEVAPGRNILEIGCGRGHMARELGRMTGMDVLGVDLSQQFIEEAERDGHDDNVTFRAVDFLEPGELGDETFDYIVGNGILHHLYLAIDASLTRMRTMLRPGGRLIFLEPNLHNPYVYLIFSSPALRRRAKLEPTEMAFTRAFIAKRLRRAGFTGVEVQYRDFLVPGVPLSLVRPLTSFGSVAEQVPVVKHLAQSLFISAAR